MWLQQGIRGLEMRFLGPPPPSGATISAPMLPPAQLTRFLRGLRTHRDGVRVGGVRGGC